MGTQVILDDDVRNELIDRAVKLDMVFSPMNDLLRVILGMKETVVNTANYPSSGDPKVEGLLAGLRDTIFGISKNGMALSDNGKRWIANPNVVTITVQEARAHNLRITVYGRPHEFEEITPSLDIRDDMAGYSRFIIDTEIQLPSAIKVIQHSYNLKKERGRVRLPVH